MREDVLYTPEEIAQKLKLSKYTIYEMIKRGEIPAHRIGRSLRISDSQLETYLMQSKQADNSFEAEIFTDEDGEKIARVIGATKNVDIVVATDIEGSAKISIMPEDIIISRNILVCSARNNIEGIITGMEEIENGYRLVINIGIPLTVNVTKRAVRELELKLGDTVYAVFKAMSVTVV
ncbi:MAG: helix-turn-helix domain-containing protein [Eubacteriales bacterium]|nr:helix-turn-helix domain-containing protein [Eubacteriales bacterium]